MTDTDRDESGGLTSLEEWEGRLRGYAGSLREGLSGRHEVAGVMENIADKILARRLRRGREGDVEAAFREGFRYGFDAGELGASYYGNRDTTDVEEAWAESEARDALTAQGEPGEDEPKCSCGHDRSVHAMSYPKYRGRYCKLCPCTGYSRATKEKNHELADR